MTVEKSASVRFSLPYCQVARSLKELMAKCQYMMLPPCHTFYRRLAEYGTQWDPIRRFLEAALGLRGLRVVIKIEGQTGLKKIYF